MKTQVIKVNPERVDPEVLRPAADCLKAGGIVGVPTETVYGLAVNLDHPDALRRLLEIRGSPPDKRVTVHTGSLQDAERFARISPCGYARRLASKFWPGPLTLVVPAAGGGDVGVRIPAHPAATEFLRLAGARVGIPSANRNSEAPATSPARVLELFDGQIDYLIDAGPARHGIASTVVRATGRRPEVLREGAIPPSVVLEVGAFSVLFVCTGNTCRSPIAERLYRKELSKRLGVEESSLEALGYRVGSAGTLGLSGGPPTENTLKVLAELGVDASDHRSRSLSIALLQDADVVYVMTRRHLDLILEWIPECRDHVSLLDPAGGEVDDPIGQELDVYRACARRIAESVARRAAEAP